MKKKSIKQREKSQKAKSRKMETKMREKNGTVFVIFPRLLTLCSRSQWSVFTSKITKEW